MKKMKSRTRVAQFELLYCEGVYIIEHMPKRSIPCRWIDFVWNWAFFNVLFIVYKMLGVSHSWDGRNNGCICLGLSSNNWSGFSLVANRFNKFILICLDLCGLLHDSASIIPSIDCWAYLLYTIWNQGTMVKKFGCCIKIQFHWHGMRFLLYLNQFSFCIGLCGTVNGIQFVAFDHLFRFWRWFRWFFKWLK